MNPRFIVYTSHPVPHAIRARFNTHHQTPFFPATAWAKSYSRLIVVSSSVKLEAGFSDLR